MENRILLYDVHLLDGEGAGAATASTAGSEQASQEQPKVEYGKAKGDGSANSQVGSDNGGQAEAYGFIAAKGQPMRLFGEVCIARP